MTSLALYALLFAVITVPGIPIGRALFGRHPAAYIAGATLGYALTTLAFWAAIELGATSNFGFAVAWALTSAAGCVAGRFVRPVPTSPWTRGDTRAIAFIVLLTLVVSVPPFLRVGQQNPDGTRLYRAYFTADFVWHMALTAEVAKFDVPLRNPYLASERIHYYWGYFIVPAVVAERGPSPLRSVETCLKGNAVAAGLLFTAILYLLARVAVPRPAAAAIAVALAIVASSAEGVYETWWLWRHHIALRYLQDTNIDAISNWRFHGLRVDGLQRCLWYVPHHMMSYAAGCVALVVAGTAGVSGSASAILAAGLMLGAAVVFNPLVGAMFAVGYAGTIVIDAERHRVRRRVPLHALAALPVMGALAWCFGNHMLEGASHALSFGLHGLARHAPLASLGVSLGPVLIVALAGLVGRPPEARLASVAPALVMIPLSLALMHFVSLDVDAAYVGFRAGQITICAAVMLMARAAMGLFAGGALRLITAAVLGAALVAGLPTTVVDWYNARDTENRARSIGGFRWTIDITYDEQQAFRWLKRATPADAIVQMEPIGRGRETWSLVPSFAERRMACGLPISLLHVPAYDAGSKDVQLMYATTDATVARAIARRLGIDYIYADRVERTLYAPGIEKFETHPEMFTPVFNNHEVRVFAVR